jgi:hypothetical protein
MVKRLGFATVAQFAMAAFVRERPRKRKAKNIFYKCGLSCF